MSLIRNARLLSDSWQPDRLSSSSLDPIARRAPTKITLLLFGLVQPLQFSWQLEPNLSTTPARTPDKSNEPLHHLRQTNCRCRLGSLNLRSHGITSVTHLHLLPQHCGPSILVTSRTGRARALRVHKWAPWGPFPRPGHPRRPASCRILRQAEDAVINLFRHECVQQNKWFKLSASIEVKALINKAGAANAST